MLQEPWPHWSPEVAFLLVYILAVVLWFAVTVMGAWHLWSIANAETSVESQDNDYYRKIAKGRGEVSGVLTALYGHLLMLRQDFVNSYDLGYVYFEFYRPH